MPYETAVTMILPIIPELLNWQQNTLIIEQHLTNSPSLKSEFEARGLSCLQARVTGHEDGSGGASILFSSIQLYHNYSGEFVFPDQVVGCQNWTKKPDNSYLICWLTHSQPRPITIMKNLYLKLKLLGDFVLGRILSISFFCVRSRRVYQAFFGQNYYPLFSCRAGDNVLGNLSALVKKVYIILFADAVLMEAPVGYVNPAFQPRQ